MYDIIYFGKALAQDFTFLMAERMDDQLSLFDEGYEDKYFSDNEELGDKIQFYFANYTVRKRIASARCARCLRSGCTQISASLKKFQTPCLKKTGKSCSDYSCGKSQIGIQS